MFSFLLRILVEGTADKKATHLKRSGSTEVACFQELGEDSPVIRDVLQRQERQDHLRRAPAGDDLYR
jgi:hypothetical protein